MTPLPEILTGAATRLEAASAWDGALVLWSIASFSVGLALMSSLWAMVERRARRALEKRNETLSTACRIMSEQHYRERLSAEERHLLTFDSTVRNILEYLERALTGTPRA